MRLLIISMLILEFSSPLFSQKCKFDKEGKDEFTGTSYRLKKMYSKQYKLKGVDLNCLIKEEASSFYLLLQLDILGKINTTISDKNIVNLKLNNGTVLTLKPRKAYEGTPHVTYEVKTNYKAEWIITRDDMEKIALSEPEKIRIEIDQPYDLEIKNGADFTNSAKCFLKN